MFSVQETNNEKTQIERLNDVLEEIASALDAGNTIAISGKDIVSDVDEQFLIFEKAENVLFSAERVHNALGETWNQTATPLKKAPLVVALANTLIKPYHYPEWRADWHWAIVTNEDLPIIFPAEEFYLGYDKADYLYIASAKNRKECLARYLRVLLSRLRRKKKA